MKLQYFKDTDPLYIEFKNVDIVDTQDLDENTLLEFNEQGEICAITMEHASQRADLHHLTMEGIVV